MWKQYKQSHGYLVALGLFIFTSINTYGLIALWGLDGFPRYKPDQPAIIFISHVGAVHKNFFMIFSILSAIFLVWTDALERDSRRSRRSIVHKGWYYLDVTSQVGLRIGTLSCALLSIFDAANFWITHCVLALIYMHGVGFSLITQAIESIQLSRFEEHPNHYHRRLAFAKCSILLFGGLIVFNFLALAASCLGLPEASGRCYTTMSAAGVLEWLMAMTLSLYYLTFTFDLYPHRNKSTIEKPVWRIDLKQSEEKHLLSGRLRLRSPNAETESFLQKKAIV